MCPASPFQLHIVVYSIAMTSNRGLSKIFCSGKWNRLFKLTHCSDTLIIRSIVRRKPIGSHLATNSALTSTLLHKIYI